MHQFELDHFLGLYRILFCHVLYTNDSHKHSSMDPYCVSLEVACFHLDESLMLHLKCKEMFQTKALLKTC